MKIDERITEGVGIFLILFGVKMSNPWVDYPLLSKYFIVPILLIIFGIVTYALAEKRR